MVDTTTGIPTNSFASSFSAAAADVVTAAAEGLRHTYCDRADDDDAPHLLRHLILESTIARQGKDHSFPIKLHYMLGKVAEDGLSYIVSWQSHGRCFVVHDQKEFVERILKCYFRQSKFASFQRQLNLYGFRRLTTGRDRGGYYHEFFLRSRPLLAHRVLRTRVKGTGTRKPASPETEPDFYLMRHLPTQPKQQLSTIPAAAPLSLQSLLTTTSVETATTQPQQLAPPPTTQPPPPPLTQTNNAVSQAQQLQQGLAQIQQYPQIHPNLDILPRNHSESTLASSLQQVANGTALDLGGSDVGLALLSPFLMPTMNNAPASSLSNNAPVQNNALNNYEGMVSAIMRRDNMLP